jgi:hypothetical protein
LERLLEGEEDGGTAHVAAMGEDVFGLEKGVSWQAFLDGFEDVTAAAVADQGAFFERLFLGEGKDGVCGEIRDVAVELVAEVAVAVDEADFFAVLGKMEGVEMAEVFVVGADLFAVEQEGGSTVSEEAKADEHARVVIEVEGG